MWAAPLGLCCASYCPPTVEEAAPALGTSPDQRGKDNHSAQEAESSVDTLSGYYMAFEGNEECGKLFVYLSLVSCDFWLIAIKSESALRGQENRGSS